MVINATKLRKLGHDARMGEILSALKTLQGKPIGET